MKDEGLDWKATGCTGKQSFDTKALAERVATLSSGRRSAPMNAYKCQFCGKYHIGNRVSKPPSYNKKPKLYFKDVDDDML